MDKAKRLKIYSEACRIVKEEVPFAFMYEQIDLYGVSARLNWAPRPDEKIFVYKYVVQKVIHGEMGNPGNPIPLMGGQGRISERLYQCDSTREEVGKQGRSSLDAPLLDRKSRFSTVLNLC